jgi:multiple sugar transport system ATP-binding protein
MVFLESFLYDRYNEVRKDKTNKLHREDIKKMASLSLKNICKVYPNGFEAVKDFNLEVEDKEFIIFVGPSGCGKSTTLRMIAGLEEISSGELSIDGKIMNDVEPKDRDIAMVFQNYALYPHMTVFDNMAFGLKLRKVPKDEIKAKVEEAARILDLEKLLDRKPKALSGGQRQRVAMGRAIVRNPKVFLMDEPLSNLDAKLRVQMRSEIASLHNRLGATIIYVTHDQTEAMTLGTRIVVLKDGVIMQVDSPQKLYNQPNNLFVAGFIGSPQMNFVDADVEEANGKAVLKFGNYSVVLPDAKSKKVLDGGYAGKKVTFGIRPEDISDDPEDLAKFPESIIESDVTGYELLGAEVLLYYTIAGANMTARVDSNTPARYGDHIKLALDPAKIHVFDKETELTITN